MGAWHDSDWVCYLVHQKKKPIRDHALFVVALSYLSAARRIERNAVPYVVAVAKIYGCLL
ncbi:unknown [Clostridium sp. CAG:632]|nr:unknown [Clostridium sp. CAG:632]